MSTATPVVRRMVMFKHGVAYVERGGPCDGSFELSFKRDEMNDVLKSLAVWVAKGGATVGAVAFEKPEDPEQALVRRRLAFDPQRSLGDLLASLRGRRVALDAGGQRKEGEVVGIETGVGAEGAERKHLVLRTSEDGVAVVDLATLRGLELLEAPSRADLAFFVDRSRAANAGESRTIGVAVHGEAEDLRVSYVVPAPTWRVSYRIARTGDATTLVGWGIVHNPVDEDLDAIDLTLTTGQPVSFVIDLYNPKNVHRAVVEEQTREVAAPTQFERARRKGGVALAAPPPMPGAMPVARAAEMAEDTAAYAAFDAFGGAPAAAATFEDRGELFEYRVASRVALKRGGSAMVPLFSAGVDAQKERIWRDGSGHSPDLVLSFMNTTGAVLEEGAAVVYDDAVYAGEAMVPYSARGAKVLLAFAKDLAIRCKREEKSRVVLDKIRLGGSAFIEEMRSEVEHTVTVESDHGEPVKVIVELPKLHGRTFDPEAAQPFEDTASYHRFAVDAPPGGRATLRVVERWFDGRTMTYDKLDERKLHYWLENRFLDRGTFERLGAILAAYEDARALDARRHEIGREKQAVWQKQSQIAEQLKVLRDAGPEGELRLRYVKELEASQDRINAAEAEEQRLADGATRARARASELVANLERR